MNHYGRLTVASMAANLDRDMIVDSMAMISSSVYDTLDMWSSA